MTYTLKICFNEDTDEIEYIAEGYDGDTTNIIPVNPFNLQSDVTEFFTSEDMEVIKELYDIEDS
jgi:hypothetical protein